MLLLNTGDCPPNAICDSMESDDRHACDINVQYFCWMDHNSSEVLYSCVSPDGLCLFRSVFACSEYATEDVETISDTACLPATSMDFVRFMKQLQTKAVECAAKRFLGIDDKMYFATFAAKMECFLAFLDSSDAKTLTNKCFPRCVWGERKLALLADVPCTFFEEYNPRDGSKWLRLEFATVDKAKKARCEFSLYGYSFNSLSEVEQCGSIVFQQEHFYIFNVLSEKEKKERLENAKKNLIAEAQRILTTALKSIAYSPAAVADLLDSIEQQHWKALQKTVNVREIGCTVGAPIVVNFDSDSDSDIDEELSREQLLQLARDLKRMLKKTAI